jgi:hypothetical protein
MLSVVILHVVMLSIVILHVVLLSVVKLIDAMLNVISGTEKQNTQGSWNRKVL